MSGDAPHFEPQGRESRPTAANARPVGRGQPAPEPTRVAPIRQDRANDAPPSIAPARQSIRPGSASQDSARQEALPRTIQPASAVGHVPPSRGTPGYAVPREHVAPSYPEAGYGQPPQAPVQTPPPRGRPARRRRRGPVILALLLALALAWPVGLALWANGKLTRVEALSSASNTPGATYLLVGSDSRADGQIPDGTEGQRADTIILLNRAPNGQTAMISLPRDTLVGIPERENNKLNASYAFGGPQLLVQTVEGLTGLTVDHYVEIGMGGVVNIVDAVGGVELCLDYDVSDELSELEWQAGCHVSDGRTALAFARMRYSDPMGDIGRAERQRQVIGAVVRAAATPSTFLNPFRQVDLVNAGVGSLAVGEDTSIIGLGRLALAFRAANAEGGFTGAPPIASMGHDAGAIGSVVLLADSAPDFFARLQSGDLTPADFGQ